MYTITFNDLCNELSAMKLLIPRIDAVFDDPAQTIREGNIDEDDKGGVMVLEGKIIYARENLTLLMIQRKQLGELRRGGY